MSWIQDIDFRKQIKQDMLERIIEGDPSIITEAELSALTEIESYLSARYNMAAVWATEGADRNALLVMYAVDIILYHIHSRLNPRQVPDIRADRYDAAIKWLSAVNKGNLSAALPPAETGAVFTKFHIGSNARRPE